MSYDKKPSFFFIANLLNLVLATGVFTLPFSLYETGIVLGTIILVFTCTISVIACSFIIESLAMQNSIYKEEHLILQRASLIQSNTSDSVQITEAMLNKSDFKIHQEEREDNFYISKRFEISKLANKIFNKPAYFFSVIVLVCYLYIGVTSNGIIAGNSLIDIIGKTFGTNLDHGYYYVIVGVFYFVTLLIALNNISKLKQLSIFIMICRFLIIFIIIGCSVYSISKYGGASFDQIPKFNGNNITIMIGNSLFFFMSHHSMPGMVENFSPQKNLMKLLIVGYIGSLMLMLIYGYISVFAFGVLEYSCDNLHFPCAIQSVFSLNFLSFPVFGYIINYYPIFNVITSAMQLITLKNNILQAIGNCSRQMMQRLDFSEKTGLKALMSNFLINLIICIPPITIAMTLSNIQQLMKYFSSILGFMLMMVIPSLLIYSYRRKYRERGLLYGKINRSFVKGNLSLVILGIVSLGVFALIIYGFFFPNIKTCVNQIVSA